MTTTLGGCQHHGSVLICTPSYVIERSIRYCPTCERRRRFVSTVALWYDPISTCCGCGDSWTYGQRDPRPFARNWRPGAVSRAKRMWENGSTKSEVRAWIKAEFETMDESRAGVIPD